MDPTPPGGPSLPLGSRYVLGDLLGRGGMGDVFRAWDHAGMPYAAKILRPELARDPVVVGRFVQERAILTALRGEHLVRVHDLVVEGDTLALVMDLVLGTDLRRELQRVGAYPPAEAARIGAGVAAALAVAHAAGVVHLDVKPENVLLEVPAAPGTPGPPVVRLTDFGVARLVRAGGTEPGHRYGTPKYVAPEVAAGEPVGPAADLYSLGVLLYELACGRPPFDGEPAEVLEAHARRIPGRPPGMPDALWHLVAGLLAKRPEQRPGPAAGVWAALAELAGPAVAAPAVTGPGAAVPFPPVALLADPGPSAEVPAGPAPTRWLPPVAVPVAFQDAPPAPSRRRRRGPLVAAAMSFALGLAAGAWALLGDFETSGTAPAAAAEAPVDPGAGAAGTPAEPAPEETAAAPAGCDASVPGDVPYPGELGPSLRGTYSEDVVRVQQRLRDNGYDICVDGSYGPQTAESVSAFQRANGLPGGGTVGPVTWAKLFGQQAPAQEVPAQQAPAQEAPAQQVPAQQAPAQQAPAEGEQVQAEQPPAEQASAAPAPAPGQAAPEPTPTPAPAEEPPPSAGPSAQPAVTPAG